jgi:hypothetical protein
MSDTPDDPIALLEAGQQALCEQFAAYRQLCAEQAGTQRRQALAEQACLALAVQSRLEEELVYPRLREASADDELLDEAQDEHASARDLMCQVLVMDPSRDLYDATVGVLGDYVAQHTQREREWLFPRLQRCVADLPALAGLLHMRRRELEAVPEALREEALVSMVA